MEYSILSENKKRNAPNFKKMLEMTPPFKGPYYPAKILEAASGQPREGKRRKNTERGWPRKNRSAVRRLSMRKKKFKKRKKPKRANKRTRESRL